MENQADRAFGRHPDLQGKAGTTYSWIYQTWLEIRNTGEVELVTQIPKEGVIVTLSGLLHSNFRAGPEQFVVAVVADFLPHPGAQVQILQNPVHARRLPGTIFVPHWPQQCLLPRDPARGTKIETAAFFGDPVNLDPGLADEKFRADLFRKTGVRLEIRYRPQWHDFSDVDVVIAIRDFSRAKHLAKPATKLYNAWLAGVPMIGGSDSAFSAEGTSGVDHLTARSPDELLQQILRLKENPAAWQNIVDAGKKCSATRSRETTRNFWVDLCRSELPRRLAAWEKLSRLQQAFFWQTGRGIYFLDRKFRS